MSEREATVLFADVSGSTKLYETVGDVNALEAISGCLAAARRATEASGGRIVKTIGDEVMALLPGPDAAASAAAEMQGKIDVLPEVGGTKLGVRIGFHHGPILQRDDDVFGDTVNIAARLVAQAQKGQILTSAHTAALLNPIFRSMVRDLYAITVKGKADEVGLAGRAAPAVPRAQIEAAARERLGHDRTRPGIGPGDRRRHGFAQPLHDRAPP